MVEIRKLKVPAAVFWIALLAAVLLYRFPPHMPSMAPPPEIACGNATLEIVGASCRNGVMRITLKNKGAGNLGASFMARLYADVGQVYASQETDAPLVANATASMQVVLKNNWSGTVQAVTVVSQSCDSVEAYLPGLELQCGPQGLG